MLLYAWGMHMLHYMWIEPMTWSSGLAPLVALALTPALALVAMVPVAVTLTLSLALEPLA